MEVYCHDDAKNIGKAFSGCLKRPPYLPLVFRRMARAFLVDKSKHTRRNVTAAAAKLFEFSLDYRVTISRGGT